VSGGKGLNIIKFSYDKSVAIGHRLRALWYFIMTGIYFKAVGLHPKIRGEKSFFIGRNVSIGDFCWIEAIIKYKNQK